MNTSTVILKFGYDKHCFLRLVDTYGSRHNENSFNDELIVVYETETTHGRKAYLSVLGNNIYLKSGDTVQINGWYGNKLGFKDSDSPVPLKCLTNVPIATHVYVEPAAADDWEIIEKNPLRVESVILDQVRAVWPGQLIPIWISPSIRIFLKISQVLPGNLCVILSKNTEIVVNSKSRLFSPPQSLNLTNPSAVQSKHSSILRNSTESPSRSKQPDLMSSTPDCYDTLEPKVIPSPTKNEIRGRWNSEPIKKRHSKSDPMNDQGSRSLSSLVTRQSSMMSSILKLFSKEAWKEQLDTKSDSDAGSGINLNMSSLPSRSGVFRVQPMRMRCSLEECFPISKAAVNNQILQRSKTSSGTNFKLYPQSKSQKVPLETFQPSTVYVDAECAKTERLLHPYLPYLPKSFIARLQKLPAPSEKVRRQSSESSEAQKSADGSPSEPASCYVRVVAIDRKAGLTDKDWQDAADEVLSDQPLLYGHVIIPDLLRCQLKLDVTGSVWLKTGKVNLVIPHKVSIFPIASSLSFEMTNDMLKLSFTHYIKQCARLSCPLVVFQGLYLKFVTPQGKTVEVQLTFYEENDQINAKAVTLLSEANIDSVLLTIERDMKADKLGVVNKMLTYSQVSDIDPKPIVNSFKDLGGVGHLVQKAITFLHASLGARPLGRHTFQSQSGLHHGVLLVTGHKGSGKTSLVRSVCAIMSCLPILAHVNIVDCKTMKGMQIGSLTKSLEAIFDEAAWRGPAILALDNLDVIMPAPSGPEAEMSAEVIYAAKISQILQGLIKFEIDNNSHVVIFATSRSRSSLHPSFTASQGVHYIQHTLDIAAPDRWAREEILHCIILNHGGLASETVDTLDLGELAARTEGYVAGDLESLINVAIHSKYVKDLDALEDKITLNFEDFNEALDTFKPVSTRNVQLHKPSGLGWSDVGGLTSVKTALIETLKWPTKYPVLFSSCPLRLRSGIMLYGAPGTGKTMLAGVVAKECGLNFISIKGPELLSKYIGASEQAVRDLFLRAQSVKPCILFFDEFDSIAPKRGHDSTGVTDRVVNQLLTQLDGVEGLQGVYVLAATSRPDLIDPALLRPGRLDKCIHCDMPDKDDRQTILMALSKQMTLASDVDLGEIADICEYFTGADLKALLYNAQLKALHEQIDVIPNLSDSVVRIKGDNTQCFAMRRPSVMGDDSIINKLCLSASKSGSFSSSLDESVTENSDVLPSPFSPKLHRPESSDNISPRSRSHSQKRFVYESPTTETSQKRVTNSHEGGKRALHAAEGDGVNNQVGGGDGVGQIGVDDAVLSELMNSMVDKLDVQSARDFPETQTMKFRDARHRRVNKHSDVEVHKQSDVEVNKQPDVEAKKQQDVDVNKQSDVEVNKQPDVEAKKQQDVEAKKLSEPDVEMIARHLRKAGDRKRPVTFNHKERAEMALGRIQFENCNRFQGSSTSEGKHQTLAMSVSDYDEDRLKAGTTNSPSEVEEPAAANRQTGFQMNLQVGFKGVKSQLVPEKPASGLRSPSVDNPVTVFRSLEHGLSSLSSEDEAKYLAMVKEIQRRDESLFQAANDKRRTSLQLSTSSSVLMQVTQRHLLEAIKSMRPSVSPQEREKYRTIYQSFVSSRTGQFDKPEVPKAEQRATLA
ncbi:unnamed protein product [Lymnaea stagnalis]|uniref:Peroxisomal ATPase PEX1 n=1 Tax=Lymnaea stagnalis TaxID=6523 RepID=A0AAV2HGG5_LYMST